MHELASDKRGVWVACVLLLSAAGSAHAVDPSSQDPYAILRAALDPPGAGRSLTRMKMTIRDQQGARERVLVARAMRFAQGRKTLISIEAPADVRNTGFLSIDYDARGKPDEQWVYLPKLHRVSRVPDSGKADSFVGSDFSLADLGRRDPNDFQLKLLSASESVGGERCWLIESLPRTAAIEAESGYQKVQLWISQKSQALIQFKAWLSGSDKLKYFKASDVRLVDGVWTPHHMQMRTVQGSSLVSETVIDVLSVSNAASEVSDSDFTQERLQHGV